MEIVSNPQKPDFIDNLDYYHQNLDQSEPNSDAQSFLRLFIPVPNTDNVQPVSSEQYDAFMAHLRQSGPEEANKLARMQEQIQMHKALLPSQEHDLRLIAQGYAEFCASQQGPENKYNHITHI